MVSVCGSSVAPRVSPDLIVAVPGAKNILSVTLLLITYDLPVSIVLIVRPAAW